MTFDSIKDYFNVGMSRVLADEIMTGRIEIDDTIPFQPFGIPSKVTLMEKFSKIDQAGAGSATMRGVDEIVSSETQRGDICKSADNHSGASAEFQADRYIRSLVCGNRRLHAGCSYPHAVDRAHNQDNKKQVHTETTETIAGNQLMLSGDETIVTLKPKEPLNAESTTKITRTRRIR